MDSQQLADVVHELRLFGAEVTQVEAKLAAGGTPRSLAETLVSFSNSSGGTIILGLDEASGFRAAGLTDPGKTATDVASLCRNSITPPLTPEIQIVTLEGANLVAVEVPELSKAVKPAYITAKGMSGGAYVRVGEGDHRLTDQEVQQLVADRGQPRFDCEPVDGATIDDLDPERLAGYVHRLRERSPKIFGEAGALRVLSMTGVMEPTPGTRPTLGGLLALGRYPQQFFPQLNLTFVHYPSTEGPSGNIRFLDNSTIDGSIPVMLVEAMAAITKNMTRRALVTGAGRRDLWEYPLEALREAIANALVHRDLSPGSRGNQVQIEMFPDRLRISNAGGLFGTVTLEHLGAEGRSSSRNATLMKILEEVTIPDTDQRICENRGSGIREILAALRAAGMSPPNFRDRYTSFEVSFPNHTLLDEETLAWLQHLGREQLRDSQCTALAIMRRGEVMDNTRYRAATGINDSRVATFELQDLVARELVQQSGTRSGARYSLSPHAEDAGRPGTRKPRPNRRAQIIECLSLQGEASKAQISQALNVNPKTVEHWLRQMKSEGSIESTSPGRGNRSTRYRITARVLQGELFEN